MNASQSPMYRLTGRSLHIDLPLLCFLLGLIAIGLVILYSASNENYGMLLRQGLRLLLAVVIMTVLAFIPPHKYKHWTPTLYFSALLLLFAVMIIGKIGKGAQRWLDLGLFRFQPSEMMKLAVPMMASWYLDRKTLPLDFKSLLVVSVFIFLPAALIAKQPDLGTAIMVSMSGFCVIFLAGISFRILFGLIATFAIVAPFLWSALHEYQKQRLITLINPEHDPLGTGYHIIQSKIAIGSGGLLGKGWLMGSQAHLNFLPEHATDFIFAVAGEEFGFVGCLLILFFILAITFRSLKIAREAQSTFTRLLAASLGMTFFFSAFVNMGMVMGILPVVGIPLPLVSYGGTALVTFMANFGILMSIHSHRILFDTLRG